MKVVDSFSGFYLSVLDESFKCCTGLVFGLQQLHLDVVSISVNEC